jgi:hypothetical protein
LPLIETGPISLSELLDRMFTIYRKYFLTLLGTTILPFLMLIPVGAIAGVGIFATTHSDSSSALGAGTIVVGVFAIYAIYLAFWCLSWIAVTAAIWDVQLGRVPTIRGSFRAAWPHLWKAILGGILFGLIVFIGGMFLIVPGILLALAFSLIGPVIIAEGAGPIHAMGRSWELTSGYKGKIFVLVLICFGITLVMTYAVQIPMLIVTGFLVKGGTSPVWAIIISALSGIVGGILPAPLQATGMCLVYYDSRVRKEGFDLQRMIDSLAPPVTGPPEAPLAG